MNHLEMWEIITVAFNNFLVDVVVKSFTYLFLYIFQNLYTNGSVHS